MFGMRMQELLIILVILVLLFGASRLPQLGQSMGSAIRNFKKGFGGADEPAADDKEKKGNAQISSSTTVSESDAQRVKKET